MSVVFDWNLIQQCSSKVTTRTPALFFQNPVICLYVMSAECGKIQDVNILCICTENSMSKEKAVENQP